MFSFEVNEITRDIDDKVTVNSISFDKCNKRFGIFPITLPEVCLLTLNDTYCVNDEFMPDKSDSSYIEIKMKYD